MAKLHVSIPPQLLSGAAATPTQLKEHRLLQDQQRRDYMVSTFDAEEGAYALWVFAHNLLVHFEREHLEESAPPPHHVIRGTNIVSLAVARQRWREEVEVARGALGELIQLHEEGGEVAPERVAKAQEAFLSLLPFLRKS